MATTFNWIYLGASNTAMDPIEGNTWMENAGAFVGQTYGTAGDPLHMHITSAQMLDSTGNAGLLDTNSFFGNYDQFKTDMGGGLATYAFDGVAVYNATITYANGTTATITAVVVQDTSGKLFLAPEVDANADTLALEASPIRSLTLNSVNTSTLDGLTIDRFVTGFDDGFIEGTAAGDLIDGNYVEPVAKGTDKVDNNDGLSGSAPNSDYIRAGAGNDTVYANLGNDTVFAGDGNDLAYGGAGNDDLRGEAGNDTLYGDAGNDVVYGGLGDDLLYGGTGDDTLLFGAGNDTVYGGDGNDLIDDNSGGQDIGANYVDGGLGDDLIWVGDSNDTVLGGAGNDTLYGENGDDLLAGGAGADYLDGGAGIDIADYSTSGAGVTVNLATGATAGGDAAGDTLLSIEAVVGSGYGDQLTAGPGGSSLYGGLGHDTLSGGTGNDSFYGGAGNDLLAGGAGNDALYGDGGNDILRGGAGDDTLTGGAGNDVLVVEISGGRDTITDFDLGDDDHNGTTNDQFDVSSLVDAQGRPVKAFDVTISDDGSGNTVLHFPGGEQVTILGLSPATAGASGVLASMGIPCFAAGTRILTPQGQVAVEDLRPGDLVLTAAGRAVPVLWHGVRVLTAAELRDQPQLRPIRLQAGHPGARRSLVVSPQHGMQVEGPGGARLIRARHLALLGLGARVARGIREISYHHLLLPEHSLILAEGRVSESFYPGRMALAALSTAERVAVARSIMTVRGGGSGDLAQIYGPRCLALLTLREAQDWVRVAVNGVAGEPAGAQVTGRESREMAVRTGRKC
ncbi:MAG: Hint domain-containing protein [bacterium]